MQHEHAVVIYMYNIHGPSKHVTECVQKREEQ